MSLEMSPTLRRENLAGLSSQEAHDLIESLVGLGDFRVVTLALEHFAIDPNPQSIRLLAMAARSRGMVLPSRHHPDHLATRFCYSVELAISDVLDQTSPDVAERCMQAIGRSPLSTKRAPAEPTAHPQNTQSMPAVRWEEG